jgi:hypothetical protein
MTKIKRNDICRYKTCGNYYHNESQIKILAKEIYGWNLGDGDDHNDSDEICELTGSNIENHNEFQEKTNPVKQMIV